MALKRLHLLSDLVFKSLVLVAALLPQGVIRSTIKSIIKLQCFELIFDLFNRIRLIVPIVGLIVKFQLLLQPLALPAALFKISLEVLVHAPGCSVGQHLALGGIQILVKPGRGPRGAHGCQEPLGLTPFLCQFLLLLLIFISLWQFLKLLLAVFTVIKHANEGILFVN